MLQLWLLLLLLGVLFGLLFVLLLLFVVVAAIVVGVVGVVVVVVVVVMRVNFTNSEQLAETDANSFRTHFLGSKVQSLHSAAMYGGSTSVCHQGRPAACAAGSLRWRAISVLKEVNAFDQSAAATPRSTLGGTPEDKLRMTW